MEKTRDRFVDQLKGLACFLVVFGHVIMGIRKAGIPTPKSMVFVEEYIWTFHVPLFMFLSGYVYRLTGGWEAKGTRKKFLLHKLFNLGIPYFVFSSIYIKNCKILLFIFYPSSTVMRLRKNKSY